MTALPTARPAATISPPGAGLLDEFERVAALSAAPKQVKAMLAVVRRFRWGRPEASVTTADVEGYLTRLAARGLSPKTLFNYKASISRWCGFLMNRGLLPSNPCAGVRLQRREQKLPRWLTTAEGQTALRIARANGFWPEVRLALSTGLRLGELIRLRWEHVDFDRRCLTVAKSKSGRIRVVPLSKLALAALRAQRRRSADFDFVFPARRTWPGHWHYVNRPRASNWWRRAMKPIQAAVPKFTEGVGGTATGRGWHLFRHTFASRAAQGGLSLYVLGSWLGHSDSKTTAMYAHLAMCYDERIELTSEDAAGAKA